MVEGAEFAAERLGPVVEDGFGDDAVDDAEGEIDVGPRILGADCRGAGERAGRDPRACPRQVQDALAHAVALLGSEHGHLLGHSLVYTPAPYEGVGGGIGRRPGCA